jgi:hypothetical protein
VVSGQKLIQGAPIFFLVMARWMAFSFMSKVKIENLPKYCALCAWALALAHDKSGDATMLAGYAGTSVELDKAMVRFGFAYADQTEKDHKALAAAARSGRN